MPPRRRRPSAPTRWGLALLCLLAALAYLTRDPAPMAGMGHMASPPGAQHHGSAPTTPHDHSASCPFCGAAAFALEAVGVALLPAGGGWVVASPVLLADAHSAPTRLVQARAPPPLG